MSTTTAVPERQAAPAAMSAEEWQTRCDLAACYQLVDLYGMSDLAGTHISARVPGTEHFLLNPYGMFFDEITASSLIKVDVDGKVLDGRSDPINPAGFVIHSAIHMARPELTCVLHTHTRANNAIAMQKDGLLPLTQKALMLRDFLGYYDYEGAALDLDERERMARAFPPGRRVVILRNHGALTAGRSIPEAFMFMKRLEDACRYQVDGLAGGRELNWLSDKAVERTAAQGTKILGPGGHAEYGPRSWPPLLRKLERERGTAYRT
ncbi:class II aldolase/adducin family protein [Pigmentiphaga soli]|uniref:Class II aldolase/adducin family protein n=1 Tax=Pigmentiphaga soli TaxID=1007095 RepID=A0ABP8GQJ0_9BURK